MRMAAASGSRLNWLVGFVVVVASSGLKDHGMVSAPATLRPSRVVAAKETWRA